MAAVSQIVTGGETLCLSCQEQWRNEHLPAKLAAYRNSQNRKDYRYK